MKPGYLSLEPWNDEVRKETEKAKGEGVGERAEELGRGKGQGEGEEGQITKERARLRTTTKYCINWQQQTH